MPRPSPKLTPEKLVLFESMFLAGDERAEIADALGIFFQGRFIKKMMSDMSWDAKVIRYRNWLARKQNSRRVVRNESVREPTAESWADKDRRFEVPRSLTAEWFGDPRPGQSALDKMRA